MPHLAIHDVTVERAVSRQAARRILDRVTLTLEPGTVAAITGPSGAGKTTLLHAVAGIVRPSAGAIMWDGVEINALSESGRDRWRRQNVGIVFQDFQLIAELSVIENILLPVRFDRFRLTAEDRRRAATLAAQVGLEDPHRRAAVLSPGEQQRAAIARALIRQPKLLLADEPTASLDAQNGKRAADLLVTAAHATQATLLIVTHDRTLIERVERQFCIEAGSMLGRRPHAAPLRVSA